MHKLTPRVVSALERIAPRHFADLSWDNVGLLVDAVNPPAKSQHAVALSLDLSLAVVEECISSNAGVLVCYHPVIFPSLKTLLMRHPKQHALLLAIRNGISIISPHTSLDNCPNGINEWIAVGVVRKALSKMDAETFQTEKANLIRTEYLDETNRQGCRLTLQNDAENLTIAHLIEGMKRHFQVESVRCALSAHHTLGSKIQNVGICAGSGSSLFRPYASQFDCVISGEIAHHDILHLQQSGTTVLLVEHGTSERGYLSEVLQPVLTHVLNESTDSPQVQVRCLSSDVPALVYY